MAICYQVTREDGTPVTLNKLDEMLCEISKVEVDNVKYCGLFSCITTSFIGMELHGKTLVEELEADYKESAWLKKDLPKIVEMFEHLTIKTWRE